MKRSEALPLISFHHPLDESTKFIFEKEIGLHGAHLCEIMTFDAFLKLMTNSRPIQRTWHELIWPMHPCKLFMDCENDWDGLPSDESIFDFVNAIHGLVQTKLGIPTLELPIILTCCRDKRFSLHLIWNRWFPTAIQCGNFVKLNFTDQIHGVKIDLAVYPDTQESFHTLRMPFNCKTTMYHHFYPFQLNPKFTPIDFCKSLVTFHRKFHLMLPEIEIIRGLYESISTPISLKKHGIMSEIHRDIVSLFVDYMKQTSPAFKCHSSSLNEYGGIELKISTYCPIADRWHATHWIFICIEACGRIRLTCPSTECRKRSIYLPVTVSDLIQSKKVIE